MGLFNGKEINELVVKTVENTSDIMAVKRDLEIGKYELESFKIQQEEKMKLLMDEILNIKGGYENKVRLIEDEKITLKRELDEIISLQTIKKDKLTILDVCKYPDIINMKTAEFKYYLFKKGIMDMTINKERNSFTLNLKGLEKANIELRQHIVIVENKLLFNKSILEYIKVHENEILDIVNQYSIKQNQYKASKKNLESRNVKNYQKEIGNICGTSASGGYDSVKWGNIYKIFSDKFPTSFDDYNKYVENEKNTLNPKFKTTRVAYVVSIMGEGNYLLKIACDLYA